MPSNPQQPEEAAMTTNPFADADIIHSYTRAQALDDGFLVDLTALASEAGFRVPVAITRTAWAHAIEWTRTDLPQDETGRAWDVLWMAFNEIRRTTGGSRGSGSRLDFQFYRVPNTGRGQKPRLTRLTVVSGPGDHAEHVLTIMLPSED